MERIRGLGINRAAYCIRKPSPGNSRTIVSHRDPQLAIQGRPVASCRSPEFGLLQRIIASGQLKDGKHSTFLVAGALAGSILLTSALPAMAVEHHPNILADISENQEFWGNVVRYISYFFSVLLGTAYVAIRPIVELMKKPQTAILVVIVGALTVSFVSFTVQSMLGVNEVSDSFTASSIVTPMGTQ